MYIIGTVTVTCIYVFILAPFCESGPGSLKLSTWAAFFYLDSYPPRGGHILEVRSYLCASGGPSCGEGSLALSGVSGIVGRNAGLVV